jgi:Pectate lyase superfamily protein
MARRLKTYQTSLGFFDLAVAAPSMKAAAQAWGSKTNDRTALKIVLIVLSALIAALFLPSPALAGSNAPQSCDLPPKAPVLVNVTESGAKGDGKTDDTAAIQAAIDTVAGSKGTVFLPDGTYMVAVEREQGLNLKSSMTLKLSRSATIKAMPTKDSHYALLRVAGASNVWITGGTLEGERDQHRGKSGEWGMGLHIGKGAKNITVSGLRSRNMWGDGFYVQDAEDVRFCSVVAENNRRQGMSVIQADGLLVLNSVFKNTHGTRPSAGIDFEPDKESQEIKKVRIERSKFIDNAGPGILVAGKKARVSQMQMTGNLFRGNRAFKVENAPGVAAGICGNRQSSPQVQTSDGFNAYSEPVEIVSLQTACGESGFVLNREKRKKNKKGD